MANIKIWVDDTVTPPSNEYNWCRSVNETKSFIQCHNDADITELNMDYNAGHYENQGGNYIQILNWMERSYRNIPIHIHATDATEIENLREIIQRNNWTEI